MIEPFDGSSLVRTDAEIEELCQLILGLDRGRLRAAIERLEQRGSFTELQSRTLADAMRLALARDPAFADSMGTLISKGVHATVQRDSRAFGRALAPAMGPAIRNAVAMMLQGFVQSIEQTLDQTLSMRSLAWRWEAWRSGRSFAEVVFVHTLLFRVEHVFLVHREGGVQLLHASPPGVLTREPELIAAMLTAIQDFVRDAFAAPGEDTLTNFAVGELTVVVESGSHAVLAAVVRGKVPSSIRRQLRESLDRIETAMGPQLAQFAGATDEFEAARSYVEACLVQSERPQPAGSRSERGWMRWMLAGGCILLLVWAGLAWNERRELHGRFDGFLAALQHEPGIVVITTETTAEGWLVRGLRDPLARLATTIAAEHSVEARVQVDLQPYQALHPPFVQRRITRALCPPPEVNIDLQNGRLVLRGVANHRWQKQARAIADAFAGVEGVDLDGLQDSDALAWSSAAEQLRAAVLSVASLQRPDSDERRQLQHLTAMLVAYGTALERTTTLRCRVLVATDDDGVAAGREAGQLVEELARALALPIEFVGRQSTPTPGPRALQFEAIARD